MAQSWSLSCVAAQKSSNSANLASLTIGYVFGPNRSLPSETFASTGTSIPTNVVYLQKKRPGDVQGDIFMARADYVGRRANGDPLKENDLPFILEKFREWQTGTLELPEEDSE